MVTVRYTAEAVGERSGQVDSASLLLETNYWTADPNYEINETNLNIRQSLPYRETRRLRYITFSVISYRDIGNQSSRLGATSTGE